MRGQEGVVDRTSAQSLIVIIILHHIGPNSGIVRYIVAATEQTGPGAERSKIGTVKFTIETTWEALIANR